MRDRAIDKSRLLGRSGAPNLTGEERDVFVTAVRAAWAKDRSGVAGTH